jgi:hypothetical protein
MQKKYLKQANRTMKKLLLAAIAALLMALQPVANADQEKWEGIFRQCHIRKWFSKDQLDAMGWQRDEPGQTIIIEEEEIGDLEKAIRLIKQCRAFYKCLEDRRAGKVKHCYENDKRWRLND